MATVDRLRSALGNIQFMLEQDMTPLGMETLKRYVDRILKEDKEQQKEDASSEV